MSSRELPRPQAAGAVPDALLLSHLAVLVNTGLPPRTAAGTVWDIARAVAGAGRRVALVDLHLETPQLRTGGAAARQGIAEAFASGIGLQDVARELEPPGLFLVTAGTAPADPVRVWGHTRWARLVRGFERERALLLLYVPTEALPHLSVKPDKLILLAPDDDAANRAAACALAVGLDDSPDVLVVLHEADAPASPPPAAATDPPTRVPRPAPRVRARRTGRRARRGRRRFAAGTAVLALSTAVAVILVRGAPNGGRREPAAASAAAAQDAAPTSDTLYYTVQVAAFRSGEAALAAAEAYGEAGWETTVAAVRLGQLDIWHRLLVGTFATPAAAESALDGLWASGLLERQSGTILRTPHALALGAFRDPADARRVRAGLRGDGVAAYIAGSADGTARLLVGAFEAPEQARLADSILSAAGFTVTLIPRTGSTP